jgi:hypothetical protein
MPSRLPSNKNHSAICKKRETEIKFTNETPVVIEIEQPKAKEPIQMLEKTEKKYKPGERLIKESKKLQKKEKTQRKPEKKRNYKNSISDLLEELFVN